MFAPFTLFVSVYLATLVALGWVMGRAGLPYPQWAGLLAVMVATRFTVLAIDRGRWPVGIAEPPARALRQFASGVAFAVVIIAVIDVLILATTNLRHARGSGLAWAELALVYLPAAAHEELMFRGYLFQKLRAWRRVAAYLFSSVVFAALHLGNEAVTWLAIINIALAGVLLARAYELRFRLWFPFGLHLAWNLASGPILGYEVSGFASEKTLLVTRGSGSPWLTGGAFGVEGSVWAMAVEVAAIVVLFRYHAARFPAQRRSPTR